MDDSILDRARAGDGDAFEALVAPYRRELLVHCYRSLGSMQDAEDALQEVLVSAWRAIGRFDGRSLRAWLYRIATNRCLNHRRDESRRPQASTLPGADDPWWLQPIPDALLVDIEQGPEARFDARESIALSFIAGLQHLPARQRAVLVLRDVLGFPASEVAEMLGTTTVSVNSALIRARDGFRPERTPEVVPRLRTLMDAAVVDRFVDAFQSGDLHRVVEVLTEDARLSMPPEPIQCTGPRDIAVYLQLRGFWGPGVQVVKTRANGQPAFGYYRVDPTAGVSRASGLMVLSVGGGRVARLTRFGGEDLIARFGLPLTLPVGGAE
jgi:RNA polymerase sigma-70 factor (ECF subfamily)